MELRQIRSFLSIAETLHFGRTAELIHLSQPALSLQIRALEEEVGVRLFERNRRKTTLTAAGFAFAMMLLPRSCNWIKRLARQAGCQRKTGTIADRLHLNCWK
jgi:Transcriptional regulator